MNPSPNPSQKAGRGAQPRTGMKEVAQRAGVAMSSVSRVLNGHSDVSDVMRNRVLDAVAALGYEPNMLAQSMRTGATMTVGFVVGDISNPLMSKIALGAETELRSAGYTTLLTNSISDSELDVAHLKEFQQRRVDGLLLSLSDETNPKVRAILAQIRVPGVLVDRHVEGATFGAALSDHSSGITSAVEHLTRLGHTTIGLVNGSPNVRPSRERARSLKRACREGGAVAVIRAGAFSTEHGYVATREMLAATRPPTAIIVGGNQILEGVLRGLRELRLRIPTDISLVTCDDIPLAEFLTPQIATISRDFGDLGHVAAKLLLEQLAGGPARTELLPTAFRTADSLAPPR